MRWTIVPDHRRAQAERVVFDSLGSIHSPRALSADRGRGVIGGGGGEDAFRGPLRHSSFRRWTWLPAVASASLPDDLRIHDLRHTCAALLIAQGAHPKAIQTHLGHSSIQVTLDLYGHLYPDEMDRLAAHLDAAHDAKPRQVAASVRHPGGAEVIEFPLGSGKGASDQGVSSWGGEDSNLRPTDYKAAGKRLSRLRKWLKALVRPSTLLR